MELVGFGLLALGLLGAILTAVLTRQLTDEFKAWTPWLIDRAIRRALHRLPLELRERFGEEWRSAINDIPGDIGKLVVALGLTNASETISVEFGLHAPISDYVIETAEGPVVIANKTFAEMLRNERSRCRLLGMKWQSATGFFDPSIISLAVRHNLLGEMIIVGVKFDHGEESKWRFIGEGFKLIGDNFYLSATGENTDGKFGVGDWFSTLCKTVAKSGEPRYDEITAYESVAEDAGSSVSCERLLLPWKTPSNEMLVTVSIKVMSSEPLSEETMSLLLKSCIN